MADGSGTGAESIARRRQNDYHLVRLSFCSTLQHTQIGSESVWPCVRCLKAAVSVRTHNTRCLRTHLPCTWHCQPYLLLTSRTQHGHT